MGKTKIITDGCADIPKLWRDAHDVDCIPVTLIKSGGEKVLSCDFAEPDAKRFYDGMRRGVKVKSNYAEVQAYEKVFENHAQAGDEIVYIASSSLLFPAFNAGMIAAEQVTEKYPSAKILCVDTKTVSGAQALVAVEAAKYAAKGHGAAEVFEYATKLSAHARYVVTSDTFEYLKIAGKVKASAALFGNLFGIKPIMLNSALGANNIVKNTKGRQNALDKCAEVFKDIANFDMRGLTDNDTVYIAHADCADAAQYLCDKIKAELSPREVYIGGMGAAAGALFGPTAIGLFALGRPA